MDIPSILSEYYRGQEWTLNGDDYEGLIWYDERNTLPKPTLEELTTACEEYTVVRSLKEIRTERNRRLTECDYLGMSDYPHLDYDMKIRWLQYRQELRDLPKNTEDPTNPVWPVPPK